MTNAGRHFANFYVNIFAGQFQTSADALFRFSLIAKPY